MTLHAPEKIIPELLAVDRRLLLFGESGTGKSTLAQILARNLKSSGRPCFCLSADPGSPAFGPPGSVCLAEWRQNRWQSIVFEALCTLDSGRFRLPLVSAVTRLGQYRLQGMLLVDAPGLVRGVVGAELLAALSEAAAVDTVLVLAHRENRVPLVNELETLPARVYRVQAADEARYPGSRKRTRLRTRLWDLYLEKAQEREIRPELRLLTGTPPPLDAGGDWQGRQIAFLKERRTLAMGEVVETRDQNLLIRISDIPDAYDQILVRDACRSRQNRLATAKPGRKSGLNYLPPSDISPYAGNGKKTGPHPLVKIGEATATLLNGIFGDPLLHVRLHNRRRSVLFDLGEGFRLTAHLAHQVTDVFISHCHMDHISGFLWLMRSRIGEFPACRLYGPPGLTDHITSLMRGILWDRVENWGPRFTVAELHDRKLITSRLQAGRTVEPEPETRSVSGGLILEDQDLKVRATTLDHAATPVLAYCLEQAPKLNIRTESLAAMNLSSGPWLGKLKQAVASGEPDRIIDLPGGGSASAGSLMENLVEVKQARKLTYATDLAGSPSNREKLVDLAAGSHLFFCEAAFTEEDRRQGEQSGHLTGRACGEIARESGAGQLVPFHFSRRYEKNPYLIYDEVRKYFPKLFPPDHADLEP